MWQHLKFKFNLCPPIGYQLTAQVISSSGILRDIDIRGNLKAFSDKYKIKGHQWIIVKFSLLYGHLKSFGDIRGKKMTFVDICTVLGTFKDFR